MSPRLLTADEVADMLRVDKSWVYAATRSGRIPHIRLGRYVRFNEDAVTEWMLSLSEQSSHSKRP